VEMILEIGDVNSNNQKFIRKTNQPYVVILNYIDCSHEYGANGLDFYKCKCQKCQGGVAGLPFD
jgi:hypothetical protein